MLEIQVSDRKYTWSSMRRRPSMAKLDRILVSIDWETHFPLSYGRSCIRNTSDHVPILLSSSGTTTHRQSKCRVFRFEKMWLTNEGCKDLVNESWTMPVNAQEGATKLVIKLGRLRKRLKRWSKVTFGNIFKKKENTLLRIEELERKEETQGINDDEFLELTSSRADILKIYAQEEILWRQRSRIKWLQEGDANTAFFHKVASMRRRNNLIHSLQINDKEEEDPKVLMEHIDETYRRLFGGAQQRTCEVVHNFWPPNNVTLQDKLDRLESPFEEEEVKSAVWGLGADKAPGPDGFPILFYKEFWETVKDDVLAIFNDFYHGKLDIGRINYATVTLIPKKTEVRGINDLRPISLLNCSLKIISKVLANRLKIVLSDLIDEYQTGFVAGRDILDGIATTQEIIQDCRRRKIEGFLLKLDFEKAYDTVEWGSLLEVLRKRRFGERWIGWIIAWLHSAKINVMFNGEQGREVRCKRGLRQGDPLSPLLFTLVADGLNRMLELSKEAGIIQGLGERQNLSAIVNLQFADDTLIFGNCDVSQAVALKWGLFCFELWSGLKVNFHKSSILFLGNSNQNALSIASILNCPIGSFPLSYLGIPIRPGKLRKQDWNELIEKIQHRLDGWKGKLLSLGGRLTLLNSVVSAIPLYFLSFFQMPRWVRLKIDRIRRTFLWHGTAAERKGYALIKWGIVCKRKEHGGMGILNLQDMNQALLSKWIWKLHRKKKAKWAQLIRLAYMKEAHMHAKPKNMTTMSGFWRGVYGMRDVFLAGATFTIGNGSTISFWKDKWCGPITLKHKFPTLFDQAINKDGTVDRHWCNNRWRIRTLGRIDQEARREKADLIQFLDDWKPQHEDSHDEIKWSLCQTGEFSVRSLYSFINDGGVRPDNNIWSVKVPLKVRAFNWLAERNSILTKENLLKRNWQGPDACVLCSSQIETVDHLFLNCTYTRKIWEAILANCFRTVARMPNSLQLLWNSWKASNVAIDDHEIWDITVATTCWDLWGERNNRIFRHTCMHEKQLLFKIVANIMFWASGLASAPAKKKVKERFASIGASTFEAESQEEVDGEE